MVASQCGPVYLLKKVGGIAALEVILFSVKFLSTIKEAVKQPVNRERLIVDLPFEWGVNGKFVKWATEWAKRYAHQ